MNKILPLFLLSLLITTSAVAADPAASPPPTTAKAAEQPKEAAPKLPPRNLKFDRSAEEIPLPFANNPKLVLQRYAAKFTLRFDDPSASIDYQVQIGENKGYPANTFNMPWPQHVQSPGWQLFMAWPGIGDCGKDGNVFLNRVAESTPRNQLPPGDIVVALTKDAGVHVMAAAFTDSGPGGAINRHEVRFVIVAPTPERVEELTRGLLTLVDRGVLDPLFTEVIKNRTLTSDVLKREQAKFDEAAKKLAGAQKELEGIKSGEDVSRDTIADFVNQQRMISVDVAGIKARIEACNKLLEGREKLSPSRIDQVETVKTTAEIELVGLAAKRDALDEMIKAGRRHREIRSQAIEAQNAMSGLEGRLKQLRDMLTQLDYFTNPEHVLGQVVQPGIAANTPEQIGKITIRPIKWGDPNDLKPAPAKDLPVPPPVRSLP